MRYYSDYLVRVMRDEESPDTGWGVLSMQARLYVEARRTMHVDSAFPRMIRQTIVSGLTADMGTPEGVAKVEATVTLLVNYWAVFDAYGIEAATKLAREAA